MIYNAVMRKEMFFSIKADSEEEAYDWISMHDMSDVEKETTYFEYYYEDMIDGEADDGDYVAVDISTEE